ncbi:MAG: hypothetical protein OSB05_13130 [Akkermansiaceae bacterium]|nr:hypothetical protein [Akkermansiaceae bacterium]
MSDPDSAGGLDLDDILFPVAKKDTKTMDRNLVSFLFVVVFGGNFDFLNRNGTEIIAAIPEISPLN